MDATGRHAPELAAQIVMEVVQGGGQQHVPFAGQSAGLISDVLPADRIVARTVHDAERVLDSLRRGDPADGSAGQLGEQASTSASRSPTGPR